MTIVGFRGVLEYDFESLQASPCKQDYPHLSAPLAYKFSIQSNPLTFLSHHVNLSSTPGPDLLV